jgi:hypothetical protein
LFKSKSSIHAYVFISRENEANKRKLQQTQVKLEQIEAKERERLAKFQESLVIIEQHQFDKTEVDCLSINFFFLIVPIFI